MENTPTVNTEEVGKTPFLVLTDCELRFYRLKDRVVFEVHADGNLLADGTLNKSEEKWAEDKLVEQATRATTQGRKA